MSTETTPAPKSRTGLFVLLAIVLMVMSFASGLGAGILTASVFRKPVEPFKQTGSFMIVANQEGIVNFPIPYSSPPNVELDISSWNKTAITECTTTGFKWKNTGTDDHFNNGKGRWTATGVR